MKTRTTSVSSDLTKQQQFAIQPQQKQKTKTMNILGKLISLLAALQAI